MKDTIGNPGRADVPVTRIEGGADDLIAYFDEQAADLKDAAIYNNYRALVDVMNAYDLDHDEIEITYSFRAVNPPASEYTQVGNYVLVGEIEVPSADGSADTAELIDLITAFFAASGDMNLSRVVGPDPGDVNSAALYHSTPYIMTFGDIPATSAGDGSTDFFLVA